ncbi:nuclear transport factor 2 family protein [Polyangium fumosum]|nr:nuclear transport factor 2 family protein [Polyangium fumosum]
MHLRYVIVGVHSMDGRPYELYISLDDLAPLWSGTSGWENEAPLRAALVSLELVFLLIADTARDARAAAPRDERMSRLWSGAVAQIRLLGDVLASTPPPTTLPPGAPSRATNLHVLADLAHHTTKLGVPTRLVRQWADTYDATCADVPFLLGLEPAIDALRAAHGLPERRPRTDVPTLPYDAWAAPLAVAALFQRRTFNAEDRLFASTHQGVECWMFLTLRALAAAESAANLRDWLAGARSIQQAACIVSSLAEAILILETMVLSDYHPLRVRLRDASGAQSRQFASALAAARRLFQRLDADRAERGTSLLTIYRRPEIHRDEHAFFEALTTLENRLSLFLFNHYKLAVRVLGTESLGSLGVEVQTLVDHFVKPLYPDLDRARYRHSVITSFAHGNHAGRIISDLERAPADPPPAPPPAALDTSRMRAAVAAYFDAMRDMDLDRWVRLFATNGAIESPEGSRPFRGHHGLRVFFRNFMKVFERGVVVTERAVRIDAREGRAEVDWQLDVRHQGIPISYTGTERFSFSPAGEIVRVTVLDDPRDIARQMLSGAERVACPLEE